MLICSIFLLTTKAQRVIFWVCHKFGTRKGGEFVIDIKDKLTVEQARKMSNYSQEEVAKKMKISKNTFILKEKYKSKFYIDEAYIFASLVGLPLEKIKWNS